MIWVLLLKMFIPEILMIFDNEDDISIYSRNVENPMAADKTNFKQNNKIKKNIMKCQLYRNASTWIQFNLIEL